MPFLTLDLCMHKTKFNEISYTRIFAIHSYCFLFFNYILLFYFIQIHRDSNYTWSNQWMCVLLPLKYNYHKLWMKYNVKYDLILWYTFIYRLYVYIARDILYYVYKRGIFFLLLFSGFDIPSLYAQLIQKQKLIIFLW